MNRRAWLGYSHGMQLARIHEVECGASSTPSRRTLHAELLRLCARIGYSPPAVA